MNRISLIGIIFGLILLSFLSFIAGFITSYVMLPSPTLAPVVTGTETTPPTGASSSTADPDETAKAEVTAAQDIESNNQKSAAGRIPQEGDAGKFSVKLKTMGDKLSAVQTMATLKRLGYGVYAVKSVIKGGGIITRSIYDLRVGVFNDYVSANQFSYRLQLMGHRGANVTVIPSNLEMVTTLND